MLRFVASLVFLAVLGLVMPPQAHATIAFDQNVTANVIFGSGVANGAFTVDRANGIELGIRGKLRFDTSNNNLAANTFNSQGNGTYSFSSGTPVIPGPNLPSWATTTTPVWSFEWSINSNYDGNGDFLDQFTYQLDIDFNPAVGATTFQSFDPIFDYPSPPFDFFDHSIGDNSTAAGAGIEATNNSDYLDYLGENNLAQNSWNYEFFNNGPFSTFDPNASGEYEIRLTAFDSTMMQVAQVGILVAVPEAPAWMAGLLVCGVIGGVSGYRRWFANKPVSAA